MALGQSIKAKDLKIVNSIMSGSRKRTEAPLKLKWTRQRSELSFDEVQKDTNYFSVIHLSSVLLKASIAPRGAGPKNKGCDR